LGIGPGDKVLVPAYTFVATVQVVKQVGAEPVFYDLDELPKFGVAPKAVIVAHLEGAFGRQFGEALKFAENLKIPLIEDACQALGAREWSEYTLGASGGGIPSSRKAGSIGLAGAFSFYPAKILGGYGDSGALVTDDEKLYKWVKEARNHFKNTNEDWGINSRMDNLQACILNVKFKYLPEVLRIREEIALYYQEGLETIRELNLPQHHYGRVWQDFIIRTSKRDKLYEFLKSKGIETMKNNYPFPIPKLPLAQAYEDETLRLPCNETLSRKEIDEVIRAIHEFFKQ